MRKVGDILWKKQQRGEMDPGAARIAASWLAQVPIETHECASLLDDARALSIRLQHPAYDCFYLALARRIGVPMVTADRRLHARVQSSGAKDLESSLHRLTPPGP